MHRYTHHRRAQHAPVKDVPGLKDFENRSVLLVGGFGAVHGLVQMWIERLAERVDTFYAELR